MAFCFCRKGVYKVAVWLLTWNPDRWHWEDYDEECKEASRENPIYFNWSCQSKKIQIGDEFFLIKLGKLPRGIIAHGTITEGMFEYEHWDEDRAGEAINYVTGDISRS